MVDGLAQRSRVDARESLFMSPIDLLKTTAALMYSLKVTSMCVMCGYPVRRQSSSRLKEYGHNRI